MRLTLFQSTGRLMVIKPSADADRDMVQNLLGELLMLLPLLPLSSVFGHVLYTRVCVDVVVCGSDRGCVVSEFWGDEGSMSSTLHISFPAQVSQSASTVHKVAGL